MTLDEARAHIGHGVIYRPRGDTTTPPEDGVIVSVGDLFVHVRYRGDATSKATYPEDLELAHATIEAGWEPRDKVTSLRREAEHWQEQHRQEQLAEATAPVDVAAIRARYEENHKRRADAWRSIEDIPPLLDLVERLVATTYRERNVTASYDPHKAQAAHVAASHRLDRISWTDEQWVEDARRLMRDLDGSVLDLVNGHIVRLIAALDRAEAENDLLRKPMATYWANGELADSASWLPIEAGRYDELEAAEAESVKRGTRVIELEHEVVRLRTIPDAIRALAEQHRPSKLPPPHTAEDHAWYGGVRDAARIADRIITPGEVTDGG